MRLTRATGKRATLLLYYVPESVTYFGGGGAILGCPGYYLATSTQLPIDTSLTGHLYVGHSPAVQSSSLVVPLCLPNSPNRVCARA